MEYIYAAMLLHKAGQKIDEESLKKVLTSAGVKVDEARVKALVASLEGVDIDKVIEETQVVSSASAPSVQPNASGSAEEKKEEKKEEKQEEKEEAAAEGLGALFG